MSAGAKSAQNNHFEDSIDAISMVTMPVRMRWTHAIFLIFGYVALDWVSFIHALHGLNITPWSPAPALGIVFVMRYGPKVFGLLFAAILLAESLVRDLPTSIAVSVLLACILAAGYTAIGELLRRRLGTTILFESRRELLWWALIVSMGTFCVSALFVTALVLLEVISALNWSEALTRYWIGDDVGVLVTMPLIAMLMDERGRVMLRLATRHWETFAYCAATVATVSVSLGLSTEFDLKYFYFVFLPIVWAALRDGMVGAVIAAAVAQLALISAVQLRGFSTVAVIEIQALVVVLVLLCFLVGVVIDEQRRMSAELRHSLRLAAAGEMAGAIAHEINQPLTAMAMYGNTCEDLVNQGECGERLLEVVRAMVGESQRTAEVVRRLRDFFQTGATTLEAVPLEEILMAAGSAFRARAERGGVNLVVEKAPAVSLLADRLQLEVVIRNLVANAFDAIASAQSGARSITVAAEREGADRICIRVEDSGPGVGSVAAGRLFEPFRSTKSSGLGLGLAISRAIAEAHGGRLWAEVSDHGVFKLVLPIEQRANDGIG
jgi:two-component system sensor kinase FixL